MTTTQRMPTPRAIRAFWAEQLVTLDRFYLPDEALLAVGTCMACGIRWRSEDTDRCLERAHILAKGKGGSNDVSNLHLLCSLCHQASEDLSGDAYWTWFRTRVGPSVFFQLAAMRNLDLAALLVEAQAQAVAS